MNISFIPIRYATALYNYAFEQKSDEEIYRQALVLSAQLDSDKNIKLMLTNPVADKETKQNILFALPKHDLHPDLKKFILFLFDKKREIFINEILHRYIVLYREKNNIHFGKLITASSLGKATEQKIVSVMSKKINGKLEIESNTDPKLTGGFVLEVDNVRCDASVKGKLERIKKELVG